MPVTSEALQVVQTFMERDFDDTADLFDPDVVWLGTVGGLDQDQIMRGPEAVQAYAREIREPWQSFRYEVEQMTEIGDAIVVFLLEAGHPRQGGPEVQRQTAMVIRVRAGKIAEMRGYLDPAEAVDAASRAMNPVD